MLATSDTSVTILADGTLRFVWEDELEPLLELGASTVRRASHVEPCERGGWLADMSPVAGPVFGPYRLRGEALAAERAWLAANGY